jgi:hypothetical protein
MLEECVELTCYRCVSIHGPRPIKIVIPAQAGTYGSLINGRFAMVYGASAHPPESLGNMSWFPPCRMTVGRSARIFISARGRPPLP